MAATEAYGKISVSPRIERARHLSTSQKKFRERTRIWRARASWVNDARICGNNFLWEFFFIGLAVLGNCWHPHIELRFTYCQYITVDLHVSFFYTGSSLFLAAALYTYNHITNSSSGFFWFWILLSLPKLLNLQRRWPFGGVPASQVYQRNLILSDLPRKEAD